MELFVNQDPEPKLDKIELVSILKDFNDTHDPLFNDVPEYMVQIIREVLQIDMLVVLGRGLGMVQLIQILLDKIRKHTPNALVFVIGKPEDDDLVSSNRIGFGLVSKKRAELYATGGIYTISAPILVMDIVNGTLPPETVSGLIIPHAERVGEHSPASFAIQLLRRMNSMAFFKAFSERPEAITRGLSLPAKLRVLNVRTIMLYPRFHLHVDKSLPDLTVEEIVVEQPPSVRRQQVLLSELMSAVLSDIKRRVPHLDVDFLSPYLGEHVQPFDTPDHLHTKTNAESLIAIPDLAQKIRQALQGVWHKISAQCKLSVYSLSTLQQLQATLVQFDAETFYAQYTVACQDVEQFWVELTAADALKVEARRSAAVKRKPSKYEHLRDLLVSLEPKSKVLIMCYSLRTVLGLQMYLSRSEQELKQDEHNQEIERQMQIRDELIAKKRLEEKNEAINSGRPGRRRVRGTKRIKTEGSDHTSSLPSDDELTQVEDTMDLTKDPEPEIELFEQNDELESKTSDLITLSLNNDVSVDAVFMTYSEMTSIEHFKPDHIIMFDPNLPFTREVERYAIKNEVKAYFMYYHQSVEELRYLTEMRREKDAFSKLIREKGHMPQEIRDAEPDPNDELPNFIGNSRRTYQVSTEKPRVIVDSREFRSALPQLIWENRIEIVPITLLVGDYVLTPDVVVERKSVPDLVSSFRSGRLYAQCESMHKHYKIAVLLIEFDNAAHFSMEPFKDIRAKQGTRVQREVQENITSLVCRFPKLKVIWSASPVHTAQIFKTLKESEPEPDVGVCAQAGQRVLFDTVALSMLESLPGLNEKNASAILKLANNFKELVELPRDVLVSTLGQENGGKLYDFITKTRPQTGPNII